MEILRLISLPDFLLFILAVVVAIDWYLRRNNGFWKSKGINEKESEGLFKKLLKVFKQSKQDNEVMQDYLKYGRIYGSYSFGKPLITIADPELLKTVFVKEFNSFTNRPGFTTLGEFGDKMIGFLEGDEWRRVRILVSPSFTSGRLRKMAHQITQCAENLHHRLLKQAENGKTVEMVNQYGAFTMDTISSCAFGIKINSEEDRRNPFVVYASKMIDRNWYLVDFFRRLGPQIPSFIKPTLLPEDSVAFFRAVSKKVLRERKANGQSGNDFLQLMMDASQDAKNDNTEFQDSIPGIWDVDPKTAYVNNGLTEDEVLAQCVFFFFAGHMTTSSLLSAASYFLAMHPDYQEKAIREVDDTWAKVDGKIDYDVVNRMQYLEAVINETLRLHTIVKFTERKANKDVYLEELGVTIPKDTTVKIPIHCIHHDSEWYPEPDKFDPERFTPENNASRNAYVFIPFGAGPRNCIAMRFALMEAKLCMARLLRYFRFVPTSQTKVPLECKIFLETLMPKNVILQVKRRNVS